MTQTAKLAAAAAVLPFVPATSAESAESQDPELHALWHRYREITLEYRKVLDEWDAAYSRGEPEPYDPDPIVDAFNDDCNRLADKIVATDRCSPDKAAALLLLGLVGTRKPANGSKPLDECPYQTGFALEALTALRPSLTGQIAADVGEVLDNLERPWNEFRWLA